MILTCEANMEGGDTVSLFDARELKLRLTGKDPRCGWIDHPITIVNVGDG